MKKSREKNSKPDFLRILFAMAAVVNWSIHQMGCTAAYLSARFKNNLINEIPDIVIYNIILNLVLNYRNRNGFVCEFNKSIYRLHQSGFKWNKIIDKRVLTDPCVYHKNEAELST